MTYLSATDYEMATRLVPLICVDMIPTRYTGNEWEIGVITRASGSQSGKAALVGGRIQHNEPLIDGIHRHLLADLSVSNFSFWSGNTIDHPFHVQQYLHAASSAAPYAYDPTKHAIALTYLIEVQNKPVARAEAGDFYWINKDSIPECGYNQQVVLSAAFAFLTQYSN